MSGPGDDPFARKARKETDDPFARKVRPEPEDNTVADDRLGQFGRSLVATGLNVAQGIPGMRAVEAGIGAAASHLTDNPISYRESLDTIDSLTGKLPAALSIPERMAGGAGLSGLKVPAALASKVPPLAAVLRGATATPTRFAALLGASDQALDADPDRGALSRALGSAGGAVVGGLAGKTMDRAVAGVRSIAAPRSDVNVVQREAARSASGAEKFPAAINSANAATPSIQAFMQRPTIQRIVKTLQRNEEAVANTDPTHPQMLDRVFKALSDMERGGEKTLDQLDPTKRNAARAAMENAKALKQELLGAMEATGVKPPLTMEVPAQTHVVEPRITPGREALEGPLVSGTPPARSVAAEASRRTEGTPAQQLARTALERHGTEAGTVAEDFAGRTGANTPSGPSTGWRSPRVSEVVRPGVEIQTPAMTVQTAPAEGMPPTMSRYRDAVVDYADRSREIEGVKTGQDALRRALTRGITPGDKLGRTSRAAFARDMAEETVPRARVQEGILGAGKEAWNDGIRSGIRANGKMPSLLRIADPNDRGSQWAKTLLAALNGGVPQ